MNANAPTTKMKVTEPKSAQVKTDPKPAAKGQTVPEPSTLNVQARPLPPRERLLDQASDAINGPRQVNYGDPSKNFKRIADMWSVVFGHEVTPAQVAICMDLVKTSRLIETPNHMDSWVDKIGYSALGGEVSGAERP